MDQNSDAVNHPAHYNQHSVECIEYIRKMRDPNVANAFKYIWRLGEKDAVKQEVQKSLWYIDDRLTHYPQHSFDGGLVDIVIGYLTKRSKTFSVEEIGDLSFVQFDNHLYRAMCHLCESQNNSCATAKACLRAAKQELHSYMEKLT